MDKTCSKCNVSQPVECFSKRSTEDNTYRTSCKACHTQYLKDHYQKYKETYASRSLAKRNAYAKLIEEYRRHNPCTKCGEARWYVLDFHHRDPTQKLFGLSNGKGYSHVNIYKEIAKCDVLCSNCHRELHHLEKEET